MFVYLDIVEEFSCKQCGACCRNDWLVTVDEPGYRRNQSLFASQQRSEEFSTAFIPIRSGQEPGEYASIAKNENGACHFLDEQNMCRLQKLGGHEHLDRVCQLFPRYPMDTARGVEISLSFSCPEALRLASGLNRSKYCAAMKRRLLRKARIVYGAYIQPKNLGMTGDAVILKWRNI